MKHTWSFFVFFEIKNIAHTSQVAQWCINILTQGIDVFPYFLPLIGVYGALGRIE
jgi:hypothetical protein